MMRLGRRRAEEGQGSATSDDQPVEPAPDDVSSDQTGLDPSGATGILPIDMPETPPGMPESGVPGP